MWREEKDSLMLKPLRVLIVEDSEDDALLLSRELRRGGYAVSHRRVDTAAGMEAALEEEWDLVISDHSMPSFSSLAALELLHDRGYIDLPFIIVSGRIGEDTAVAAMKAGAHDYIMKDNLARLNSAIERELREAEVRRERRRAEAKYRSIFENAVEGIFQSTADGRLLTANPAMARMYGFESPEEMLAGAPDVARLYVEPRRREEFAETLRRHGFVSGFEAEMFRRDGSRGWISLSARALGGDSGEPESFEGTAEDITARKRAEEELREIREAERRRIARDLHDVVLQDLTYTIQAMQVTRMMAEEERVKGELREEVEALQRAVGGLRAAVYDLRGGVEERPLAHSLESLAESSRQTTPEREVEFVVEEGFPLELRGGVELLRIVQEALVNVRRHSGARRVRISAHTEGDTVRLTVEDDGCGFNPDAVDEARFGLAGMRERAAALGGELEVASERGSGSRVSVTVPSSALSTSRAVSPERR